MAGIKGSPPEPVVITRPENADAEDVTNGDSPQERRPATAAEMKAFFGGAATYTP